MSLVGAVEAAATAGTPLGWVRLGWKLFPWVAIAGLAATVLVQHGQLDHIHMQAKVDAGAAQLASAQHDLVDANRTSAAVQSYADRVRDLQPVVIRSTDTVTRYASTAAGRAPCAAPDRVLGIDALDQALFPQGAAGGRAGTVPTDAGASPGGRVGDQR